MYINELCTIHNEYPGTPFELLAVGAGLRVVEYSQPVQQYPTRGIPPPESQKAGILGILDTEEHIPNDSN